MGIVVEPVLERERLLKPGIAGCDAIALMVIAIDDLRERVLAAATLPPPSLDVFSRAGHDLDTLLAVHSAYGSRRPARFHAVLCLEQ